MHRIGQLGTGESFARECDVKCLRTFHQVLKMLGDGLPADAAMCRSLQLYRLLTDLDTAAAKEGKQYARKSVWLEREDLLASLQANIDALCIGRSLSIVVSARFVIFTADARCNDRFVA